MEVDQSDENIYGNCEGPNSMYVTLVAKDGHNFILPRKYAILSSTLKAMLTGPGEFPEGETNIIRLNEISDAVLEVVCRYLQFKATCVYDPTVPQRAPNLIRDFPIPKEIALQVAVAATFFDC